MIKLGVENPLIGLKILVEKRPLSGSAAQEMFPAHLCFPPFPNPILSIPCVAPR